MTTRFRIMIEIDETLSIAELWPDGDAPPNPTVGDVEALIEKCGGVVKIMRDWSLEFDAVLTVTACSGGDR